MSNMIKVKACDLTGVALDWAVANAAGCEVQYVARPGSTSRKLWVAEPFTIACEGKEPFHDKMWRSWAPSADWAQAGPIMQRENISLSPPTAVIHVNGGNNPGWHPSGYWNASTWHTGVSGKRAFAWHETEPLIAAMRCYVRSKLGDEIEVPAELVEGGA